MRGPSFKGFLAGGAKGVFVFSRSEAPSRIAVCEAAIGRLLSAARIVVAATDRGTGGELLAGRLEDLARSHGISFDRQRAAAKDWNEQLVGERHSKGAPHQDEGGHGL